MIDAALEAHFAWDRFKNASSMNLTDAQLHDLVAKDPSNPKLLKELKERIKWNAIRKLPNRTGVCSAGLNIVMDERGAYSSGDALHKGKVATVCNHGGIVFDEPNEKTKRLRRIIDDQNS